MYKTILKQPSSLPSGFNYIVYLWCRIDIKNRKFKPSKPGGRVRIVEEIKMAF